MQRGKRNNVFGQRRLRQILQAGSVLVGSDGRIFHLEMPEPFFGFGVFFRKGPVFVQEARQRIAVDPDFIVPFFLGFVKNKLQSPVEVDGLDVVDIFLLAVAGVAHIADHVSGCHHAAFL